MKKITLGLGATALAIALAATGVVHAEQTGSPPAAAPGQRTTADPLGDATVTRAEAQTHAAAQFDRMDLNRDGKLDAADRAARIGQHFDAMDANKDGTLSRQEFATAHEQRMTGHDDADHGPHKGHGHHGAGMMGMGMKGMDADADRTVTRAEFLAGALQRFDAADSNHDSKLTPAERRSAWRNHRHAMRSSHHGMHHPNPAGKAANSDAD